MNSGRSACMHRHKFPLAALLRTWSFLAKETIRGYECRRNTPDSRATRGGPAPGRVKSLDEVPSASAACSFREV
jgi:hypothetical protein